MGRTGVCWDNAMTESFLAALKNELVHAPSTPHERTPSGTVRNGSTGAIIPASCTPGSTIAPQAKCTTPTETPSQRPKRLSTTGQDPRGRSDRLACCAAVSPTVMLADSARTVGAVVGRLIGVAITIALVVVGLRMIRTATTGGRRTLGIVLLVIGVLLALGTLVSLSASGTGAS